MVRRINFEAVGKWCPAPEACCSPQKGGANEGGLGSQLSARWSLVSPPGRLLLPACSCCVIGRLCLNPVIDLPHMFFFPEWGVGFQSINQIAGGFQSCGAMPARCSDENDPITQMQTTHPMDNGNSVQGPPLRRGFCQVLKRGLRHPRIMFQRHSLHPVVCTNESGKGAYGAPF